MNSEKIQKLLDKLRSIELNRALIDDLIKNIEDISEIIKSNNKYIENNINKNIKQVENILEKISSLLENNNENDKDKEILSQLLQEFQDEKELNEELLNTLKDRIISKNLTVTISTLENNKKFIDSILKEQPKDLSENTKNALLAAKNIYKKVIPEIKKVAENLKEINTIVIQPLKKEVEETRDNLKKELEKSNYLGWTFGIVGVLAAVFDILGVNQTIASYVTHKFIHNNHNKVILDQNSTDNKYNESLPYRFVKLELEENKLFQKLYDMNDVSKIEEILKNTELSKSFINKLKFIEAELLLTNSHNGNDIQKIESLYKELSRINDYIYLNGKDINIGQKARERLDSIKPDPENVDPLSESVLY